MENSQNNLMRYEYVWIGGNNECRSKVKFTDELEPPEWNFDGSSTNQAETKNSELLLRPIRIYNNPIENGKLVLCDVWFIDGEDKKPHPSNLRVLAEKVFKNSDIDEPLFGIEHEFFIKKNNNPLGFINDSQTPKQGRYYCSVGTGNAFGRDMLNMACELCIKAGINVTGSNLEVAPGQMEIQICDKGIKAADDSLILKYILERLGEINFLEVDWGAKPLKGEWNGSGCHVNFSTKQMRDENGLTVIFEAIKKLEIKHHEHIKIYGDDNNLRLTGNNETSDINTFSYGYGDRSASIRIPYSTKINKCGYFEDRRPSSSANMYLVTSKLYQTCTS